MTNTLEKTLHFETLQQHAGQVPDPVTGASALPLYQSSSYVFQDTQAAEDCFALRKAGFIYSRLTNPTCDVFEKRIAALEGGTAAVSTASGMAAITYAILNLCSQGDEVISAATIYGGTYNLLAETLPQYGITTHFVDADNPDSFKEKINDKTKLILIESLGNPAINIPDFEAIVKLAHDNGLPVILDNTFATPYLFRGFDYGIDIIVHSATKFIGGHGTTIGGVIVENGKFDWAASGRFPEFTKADPTYHGINFSTDVPGAGFVTRIRAKLLRDTGAPLAPFNAWLLLQGLETLSLRVERHVENTRKVISFLESQEDVENIYYPEVATSKYNTLAKKYFSKGCGSIFSIDLKGDEAKARKFIDSLQIFMDLANVGDSKSLVIHPASTTHQQLTPEAREACGIKPGTIRLSIGIENVEDIIADLKQALEKCKE